MEEAAAARGGGDQYLAISVVSTDSNASGRAEYEDGVSDENTVTSLRIYFFNASGQPVNVKKNEPEAGASQGGNWYDVPMEEINFDTGDGTETVEKKMINAVLVVNQGEQVPSQLVAVLNRDETAAGLGNGPYTLTGLRRKVGNYASLANTRKQFVMTNSVYLDGGKVVEAQTILPENLQKTADKAKGSPVTIYVERNVAKVRVNATITGKEVLTGGGIMCQVYKKKASASASDEPYTIVKEDGTETSVYVKFHGWDISADLQYAFLSKNIRLGWKENVLGAGSWNDAPHHRSYWADVCDGGTDNTTNKNQYFSYNEPTNFTRNKFDGSEWKYCNENGEKEAPSNIIYKPTKILIKGELCDADGNSLTVTEFAGSRIIDDTEFSLLKENYLLMLANTKAKSYWKVSGVKEDGTATKAEEISPADITFITANEKTNIGKAAKEIVESGSYYVYACLKPTATDDFSWYTNVTIDKDPDSGNVTKITVDKNSKVTPDAINAILLDLPHAKIWNVGKTYYFANIMQSATVPGVVRNHIYDINLKKVYGIGTPVYEPDEEIVPEQPTDEDTYVAAEIKILQWRLMTQDVEFNWD